MTPLPQNEQTLKQCCAALYESEAARVLLGDSFHPGGLALTRRLGELLALRPGQRLLDVAAGSGSSAIFLAQQFGCDVVGIDYGEANVALATRRAREAGLAAKVRFAQGDAEQLRLDAAAFDVIICECAFCTFPNKARAAQEFARVLRPGGKIGLSDLTRSGLLPSSLEGLLAWVACLANARPIPEYQALLETAGFTIEQVEAHPEALRELIREIQGKLLGVELLVKLNKLSLPDLDFERAKTLIQAAAGAVRSGKLGYALMAGAKR